MLHKICTNRFEKEKAYKYRAMKVEEIILPYQKGMSACPSVDSEDKIIHAIELMVDNNLRHIAVVRNKKVIGRVCLEDALQKLGIKVPAQKGKNL